MNRFILFFIAYILVGCTATYTRIDLTEPSSKLSKEKSVLIVTPTNGFYLNKEYTASGRRTALSVRSAFAQHANNVTVLAGCKKLICLQKTYATNYDYYVIPDILHWEDRATEWNAMPDSIEIKIIIYESKSWKELASTIIYGKSKFWTFGGDHPQDLLAEPLNKYIDSLY